MKIFIDGQEGTTGLRIHERLKARSDIELLTIKEDLRKDLSERSRLINESDITFLCLPDDAARESVSLVKNEKVRIIDSSTAHRVSEGWIYGLPELSERRYESVKNAKRLSVPGCHATGFNVLVYPLIKKEIAPFYYPFCAHSVTGYSGGGKKMIAEYEERPQRMGYESPRQYAISLNHKHLPEMQKTCELSAPPIFNPIVSNFYSGMVVTVPVFARFLTNKITAKEAHSFFESYYEKSKLIKVMPFMGEGILDRGFVEASALSGKDTLQIFVAGNDEQILLISRFDNLGKGASGAAIQCMNLMLGVNETTGLTI
ncbi:MAG: N-acetyl-gamma-glutamyl-phosphate reductase [Clostridiales bacterium]|nr:N-acetyl-gamma-glutamyl-phosphate reductase [Clostridiales bacterium]